MSTNRYYAQIKHIIRSVAADPYSLSFDLHWYDYDYLRQTIFNYLRAKQTSTSLTNNEVEFLHNAEVNGTDQSIVLETGYVDSTLNDIDTLLTLKQEEAKENELPLPSSSADYEAWMAPYEEREKQLKAFGSKLNAADLEKFSAFPQAGWKSVPIDYLETILTAYHHVLPLTTTQVTQIFGRELTQSYWPIDRNSRTFFSYLKDTGLWSLNLITLLKEAHDPKINHLVILWLQWFKHDKTFHGMEVMEDAQVTIRKVNQIIKLLKHQRFDDAAPLLLKELPGFWD